MSEQFALQQAFGDGTTVDLNKGVVAPVRTPVNGLGDHTLAGPGLTVDHDGRVAVGNAFDDVEHSLHRLAFTDDFLENFVLRDFHLGQYKTLGEYFNEKIYFPYNEPGTMVVL
jgi:hypothetical protein